MTQLHKFDEAGRMAIALILKLSEKLAKVDGKRQLSRSEREVLQRGEALRAAGWSMDSQGLRPPVGPMAILRANSVYEEKGPNWKLHRCADGAQCRSEKSGGCPHGWCDHFRVTPDRDSIPRFPLDVPPDIHQTKLCLKD